MDQPPSKRAGRRFESCRGYWSVLSQWSAAAAGLTHDRSTPPKNLGAGSSDGAMLDALSSPKHARSLRVRERVQRFLEQVGKLGSPVILDPTQDRGRCRGEARC